MNDDIARIAITGSTRHQPGAIQHVQGSGGDLDITAGSGGQGAHTAEGIAIIKPRLPLDCQNHTTGITIPLSIGNQFRTVDDFQAAGSDRHIPP
jgi:hypothetical protein